MRMISGAWVGLFVYVCRWVGGRVLICVRVCMMRVGGHCVCGDGRVSGCLCINVGVRV